MGGRTADILKIYKGKVSNTHETNLLEFGNLLNISPTAPRLYPKQWHISVYVNDSSVSNP